MKNQFIKLCFLLIFLFSSSTLVAQINDLNNKIKPIGMAPNSHNGYGDGNNQLAQPDNIQFLKDGSMLVSDVYNNRLQLFSKDGEYLRTITGADMQLEGNIEPTGISKDGEDFIYITCEASGVIVRLKPDLTFDRFIGVKSDISRDQYYFPGNENCLITPQGIAVTSGGDVYVIDIGNSSFRLGETSEIRNFAIKKFKKVIYNGIEEYIYDKDFAKSQQITRIMRKSEGITIDESRGILFLSEEKPLRDQFGNLNKYRYVAAFDLKTGVFLNKLYGVNIENGKIISGVFNDSAEGLAVYKGYLFAVDELEGKIHIFDIDSQKYIASFGKKARYYCDFLSDCIIDGINYNEQNIAAGKALSYKKNDWMQSEMASPDGINIRTLQDGSTRLAVVDQWNMRVLFYDLDLILEEIKKIL